MKTANRGWSSNGGPNGRAKLDVATKVSGRRVALMIEYFNLVVSLQWWTGYPGFDDHAAGQLGSKLGETVEDCRAITSAHLLFFAA